MADVGNLVAYTALRKAKKDIGMAIAGLVMCPIAVIVGTFRLFIGGGIF